MTRRLLRLALTALTLAAPASAQTSPVWEALGGGAPIYTGSRSEDVVFVGPERGWSVAGNGAVYRTLDGGDTWSLTAALNGYLRSAAFATADKGWIGVLFDPAQLYETLDGGTTFTNITSRIQPAVIGGICGMWVVDEQTVYAVGQYSSPAYIVKTTDGGQTWTSTPMAPLVDELIDVLFFDAQHGLASGGTGTFSQGARARIIGTDDGGQTWTVRHTLQQNVSSLAWKFSFPSRLVGYASVERLGGGATGNAIVLKTVDGGQTWTELTVPGGGSLQGVGFATPDVGWISGRGTTSMTTDGGASWVRVPSTGTGAQLDRNVNRFRFLSDSLGFAVGERVHRLSGRYLTAGGDVAEADGAEGLTVLAPNPTHGPVQIGYRISNAGAVRVDVFDVRGRRVATLVDGPSAAGDHVATWSAAGAAPGLYVVRMRAGSGVWSRSVSVVGAAGGR